MAIASAVNDATTPVDSRVPTRTAYSAITAAAGIVAAALLFVNLGFYPFWGDEADTVIIAQGVWRTGDTSAWYGDNLYAYRGGTLLKHFKNRSVPPAAYYLVAPFYGAFGPDHFALRAVFAALALATVALVGHWLYRVRAGLGASALILFSLALNVSFLLYGRQCRYYALATLLTVGIAYLYDRYAGSRLRLAALAAALVLLAATHYMHFAAAVGALVVDYALFGRRRYRLSRSEWALLLAPVAIAVAGLVWLYNPIGKHSSGEELPPGNFWFERAKLFYWSLRDLNACEYGVGLVMAAAPLVAWWRRSPTLIRLFLAGLVYVGVTTLVSPQPVARALEADIRYLAPLIPLCVALTVLTIDRMLGGRLWLAGPLVALCVGSNILHLPWDRLAWRSTIAEFAHELRKPRVVAGRVVADWLKAHAQPGATAWVTPGEWVAEPMVEAPQVVYGWQLEHDVDDPRRAAEYAALPTIHFAGQVPVDYIVAYGFGNLPTTAIDHVREVVIPAMAERGFRYEQAASLDVYFDDRTRPELFWHWFRDQPYDRNERNIVIFQLQK